MPGSIPSRWVGGCMLPWQSEQWVTLHRYIVVGSPHLTEGVLKGGVVERPYLTQKH